MSAETQHRRESVWDYLRPPKVEPAARRVRVVLRGVTSADTQHALRVLETRHPPAYNIPEADVVEGALSPTPKRTFCEFKGQAASYDVSGGGDAIARDAAWHYPSPAAGYEALAGHVAFYPGKMDACYVGDERVQAQEGDFYGGWIISDVEGPFKGGPGTSFW